MHGNLVTKLWYPRVALHNGLRVTKIISWNLLRLTGARVGDVVRLVRHQRPDLLLMQEVTRDIDSLTDYLGGSYARVPLPGRIHGLAVWSAVPRDKPAVLKLPSGAVVERICQIVDLGDFAVANVHLSHGQVLNRRQLRHIAQHLPARAAVLGDYNLVGPALLPGFTDLGPREPTHRCADVVPLRLDRCYARGLTCLETAALHRHTSDHRPIMVRLATAVRMAA
jgi:endonuclease/exonuclease/phosphatase (EEP) superfamily protein YafD